MRKSLGFTRRNDLRRFVAEFYSRRRNSAFPPIQIHEKWAPSLAWEIEKQRALSPKGERFNALRLCTNFDVGSDVERERRFMSNWHVAWKGDNRHVAVASDDGAVYMFDADTGTKTRIFEGHLDRVESLAWDPSHSRLVSA